MRNHYPMRTNPVLLLPVSAMFWLWNLSSFDSPRKLGTSEWSNHLPILTNPFLLFPSSVSAKRCLFFEEILVNEPVLLSSTRSLAASSKTLFRACISRLLGLSKVGSGWFSMSKRPATFGNSSRDFFVILIPLGRSIFVNGFVSERSELFEDFPSFTKTDFLSLESRLLESASWSSSSFLDFVSPSGMELYDLLVL